MFNRLFRRYPATTFIGTMATGLYIKSWDDPFFFLNAWENRCAIDKQKHTFEGKFYMNNILTMWPCKFGEYANFMIFLIVWGVEIEKFYGRKYMLATIPVNAILSTFSTMPESQRIKNDYIHSLPITWALMNLLIVPRIPQSAVRTIYLAVLLLIINFDKDPRIGGISFLVMKFILKYYAKGPLMTYL